MVMSAVGDDEIMMIGLEDFAFGTPRDGSEQIQTINDIDHVDID